MKFSLFFFLIPVFYINAQTDSLFVSDIKNFTSASVDFYTSPIKFDTEDWIKLSAVVGLTGLATLADKDLRTFSQRNKSSFTNEIFNADKYYATEFAGASVIVFYGYGLISQNSNIRNLAVKLTEACFLAGSITLLTKIVVGRGRPYKQESQYYTNPFTFDNDFNSFPSGHTTLAFVYSTIMANEVDNIFWKIGWYSAAGLVGYARIYHNQHWLSDVLMSAAIGYFSGEFINNHNSIDKKSSSVSLVPLPMGLAVQISF